MTILKLRFVNGDMSAVWKRNIDLATQLITLYPYSDIIIRVQISTIWSRHSFSLHFKISIILTLQMISIYVPLLTNIDNHPEPIICARKLPATACIAHHIATGIIYLRSAYPRSMQQNEMILSWRCICGWQCFHCWITIPQMVLATELGYPVAVRVGNDPEAPVRVRNCRATRTGHKPLVFGPGWNWTAVPTLQFLQLGLQLSIWVLIVSWHDQYIDCAVLAAHSPAAFRFAIRLIFVEWLWNIGKFQVK